VAEPGRRGDAGATRDAADEDGLRGLSTGYAAAVDALDGVAFAALFLADGELWVPDASSGPEPVICRTGRDALRRIPSGLARFHATHHRVTDARYDLHGDTATGEVVGVAHHLGAPADAAGADGAGTDTIWYLRYSDTYRRTGDGWRIARRALYLRGIEERPVARLGPGR